MMPGDTVITPEGKEGKVSIIDGCSKWLKEPLVYVDFEKPNPHYLIYFESELKLKEEKNRVQLELFV